MAVVIESPDGGNRRDGAVVGQIDPIAFFRGTFGCVPRPYREMERGASPSIALLVQGGRNDMGVLRSDVPGPCHEHSERVKPMYGQSLGQQSL